MKKRRRLTFRHAPEPLLLAIRQAQQYWPCDELLLTPWNAPLSEVIAAAERDAQIIESLAEGMQDAAQRLSSRAYSAKFL